jgi:hypothetical protein
VIPRKIRQSRFKIVAEPHIRPHSLHFKPIRKGKAGLTRLA